jgi:hypothetical protein
LVYITLGAGGKRKQTNRRLVCGSCIGNEPQFPKHTGHRQAVPGRIRTETKTKTTAATTTTTTKNS